MVANVFHEVQVQKLSMFKKPLNSNFRIRTGEKLMDVRRVGNEFLQLFFAASGERWANNGVVFHSRTKSGPANGVMKHHSPTKQQKNRQTGKTLRD